MFLRKVVDKIKYWFKNGIIQTRFTVKQDVRALLLRIKQLGATPRRRIITTLLQPWRAYKLMNNLAYFI